MIKIIYMAFISILILLISLATAYMICFNTGKRAYGLFYTFTVAFFIAILTYLISFGLGGEI